MIKKILSIILFSCLGLIIFINLFQFTGLPLPDFIGGNIRSDIDLTNTYFGVSSILNFTYDLGHSFDYFDTNSFLTALNSFTRMFTFGIPELFTKAQPFSVIITFATGGLDNVVIFFIYFIKFLKSFVDVILGALHYLGLLLQGYYNLPL